MSVSVVWIVGGLVVFFVAATLVYLDKESGTGGESDLLIAFIVAAIWPIAIIFGILAVGVWVISLPALFTAKLIHKRWPQ